MAIDAGLSQRAEQIVRETAAELKGLERQSYLVEMARRADAAQLPRVAFYAYSQITPAELNAAQMLAIRARVAELALQIGDTVSAARGFRELEQSLAVGSPQRRQAVALRIQLIVKEGRLAEAEQDLAAFKQEFPNAAELDAVAAVLAGAYIDREDVEKAERVLSNIGGPRSNIARGRIALRRGDVADAKNALLAAAPSLQGAEATETIRLVTLLGRVSRQGGELLGKSLSKAAAGAGKEAFTMLDTGADQLPELERPAILDFAAALADRSSLPLDADRVRRRIIEQYPRSMEAPPALLALARSLTERGEAAEEARQYLEKLIVDYPRSALVPQARQELDRLQGRVPRS
jgi:tetratricopeptide (TPR) repeat protein